MGTLWMHLVVPRLTATAMPLKPVAVDSDADRSLVVLISQAVTEIEAIARCTVRSRMRRIVEWWQRQSF